MLGKEAAVYRKLRRQRRQTQLAKHLAELQTNALNKVNHCGSPFSLRRKWAATMIVDTSVVMTIAIERKLPLLYTGKDFEAAGF